MTSAQGELLSNSSLVNRPSQNDAFGRQLRTSPLSLKSSPQEERLPWRGEPSAGPGKGPRLTSLGHGLGPVLAGSPERSASAEVQCPSAIAGSNG